MDNFKILPGAESFLLKGNSRGVLLVHGFTGTPAEMRLLGEYLHQQGFTVLALRLPGHGTTVHDMESTNWRHWYGAVVDSFYLLRALCNEINVVGLSMGGLLALKLAMEYPVAQVAALSTPIFLTDRRISYLPFYRLFQRFAPKKRKDYDIDPQYFAGYDHTPLASLSSLLELMRLVQKDLGAVSCPVLLVQSRKEHTVRPESAIFIMEHLGSKDKELFWLAKSGHIVTIDLERETVFAKVSEFLHEHANKE